MTRSRVLLAALAWLVSLVLAAYWLVVALLGGIDGGGPDRGPLALAGGALLLFPLALLALAPRRTAAVGSLVHLWLTVPPAVVLAAQA